MKLSRIQAIVIRQLYLQRGSFTRVIPLFVWAGIDMVLWGFITKYLNAVSAPGLDFVPTLLGAVLLWDFLVRVMQGVIMAFFEDVWSRNFLNIFASPLSISEYTAGLVCSSILSSSLGLAVMLLIATGLFDLSLTDYGLPLFPFLLTLFIFGIALGMLGCSLVLRFGPAAEWFAWPIPTLISPFAGVFYPLATLPGWMQAVGHALPPAYIFESVRAIVAGRAVSAADLGWAMGLALAYLLLACWIFTRVYRHALRTGLIARYSAENAS